MCSVKYLYTLVHVQQTTFQATIPSKNEPKRVASFGIGVKRESSNGMCQNTFSQNTFDKKTHVVKIHFICQINILLFN